MRFDSHHDRLHVVFGPGPQSCAGPAAADAFKFAALRSPSPRPPQPSSARASGRVRRAARGPLPPSSSPPSSRRRLAPHGALAANCSLTVAQNYLNTLPSLTSLSSLDTRPSLESLPRGTSHYLDTGPQPPRSYSLYTEPSFPGPTHLQPLHSSAKSLPDDLHSQTVSKVTARR